MFSNQAVLSACLITLLGLVSTHLILHRQNNPMVLSFTPASHVNATAVPPLWGYQLQPNVEVRPTMQKGVV